MKSKNTILIICSVFIILGVFGMAKGSFALVAFPGAQGFGANSVGGRGGVVKKVTNLNDSGSGSFREAVTASGARIVIFNVSGIINLQSDVEIYNPYITIAGQTSPGGILITGRKVMINTHDVIVQHMRFRVGSHQIANGADPETLDSLNLWGKFWGNNDAYNIIIDHSSVSWGVDESFSITGGVTNTTVQWSIISEGLSQAGHPKGEHSKGLLVSGKYLYSNTVSIHHNYIAHNTDRSPLIYSPAAGDYGGYVDTTADVVNNVVYNWKGSLSPMGEGSSKINWVYNYARQGKSSNSFAYEVAHTPGKQTPSPQLYVYGNIGSTRLSQSEPQWNVGESYTSTVLSTDWQTTSPWSAPSVTTAVMSEEVANCILTAVGATAPFRDSVDSRVVNDFAAHTGDIILNVNYPDDFPTFSTISPPTDSDNDGMADSWETSQGLDTIKDDSALDKDGDGYTNLENYLHYLSAKSYVYNSSCMPVAFAEFTPDTTPPAAPTGLSVN